MTVLIGYIPNEYGEAALEAGVVEARRRGTGVVVVNATRGDALIDKRYVGEGALADLRSRLDGLDVPYDVRQVLGSDVAEELLEAAAESSAELIVIGLRRRSPVGKMIMGSVAQQVLTAADCPVLAVKPPG
jgi:nucleotide-binding universal stress UspA family protein